MTVFALSASSTVLYLWSLYLMRAPTRFGWGITLASLALTVVQVYMVGAYPSLVGCIVGAAICVRNFPDALMSHYWHLAVDCESSDLHRHTSHLNH